MVTGVILAAALTSFVPPADAVMRFPGSYFHSYELKPLQRQVMTSWPGPTVLVQLWNEAEFTESQRVALLVGGAVFHDPVMLPMYRDALTSKSEIIRKAALYGYREFIADRLPDVRVAIDKKTIKGTVDEMDWMARTLRRYSLLEMWLQSALIQEGASLPGYIGVRLTRSPRDCFLAAERLVDEEDLDLLVTAFEISKDKTNRIALLRLIEAVSLNRFIFTPTAGAVESSEDAYQSAVQRLTDRIKQWRQNGCKIDGKAVVLNNLRSIDGDVADPFSAESCGIWLGVLRRDIPFWWPMASRKLYACGGPWFEFSALQPESDHNKQVRDQLSAWYEPPPPKKQLPRPRNIRWVDPEGR